jgi:hypothetical protein
MFDIFNTVIFYSIFSIMMMPNRSIKVKVLKETSRKVTIQMMSLNRSMPVSKEEFDERVKSGLYEIINQEEAPAAETPDDAELSAADQE